MSLSILFYRSLVINRVSSPVIPVRKLIVQTISRCVARVRPGNQINIINREESNHRPQPQVQVGAEDMRLQHAELLCLINIQYLNAHGLQAQLPLIKRRTPRRVLIPALTIH